MSRITVHMQVKTPLFNGGAGGEEAAVRVPSLRGGMRFWFRALAGIGTGQRIDHLAALERRVFGGISPQGATTSPVKLRIPRQPSFVHKGDTPGWANTGESSTWISYLLGPGLSKLVRRTGRGGYDCQLSRPYIPAMQEFELEARFDQQDEDAAALALASLWLLCTYGGLGARTRRGFGGLRILGAEGDLPQPWSTATIRSPELTFYTEHYGTVAPLWVRDELGQSMRVLSKVARETGVTFDLEDAQRGGPSTYPFFSKRYTRAALSAASEAGWAAVLAFAGEQMRWFRASRENTSRDARYRPKIKTPEWIDSIHGNSNRMGLAALGLPINFKRPFVVNADRGPNPEDRVRRASPLWLRPVGGGAHHWRLLSFAFQGEFLPSTDYGVHLWRDRRRGKALEVNHQDVVERTTTWIETLQAGTSFIR